MQVPIKAQLLGFGGLKVRSANYLGVSDDLGASSFFFPIMAKQTSFFVLLVMFVVPIIYFISIIETIDKYLFFISVNNLAYKNILATFTKILV